MTGMSNHARDRRSETMDAVEVFRKKYPETRDVQRLFVNRLADPEFYEIGLRALSNKNTNRLDEHVIVWTGFEVASDSQRFDWN